MIVKQMELKKWRTHVFAMGGGNSALTGWNDIQTHCPSNPLEIIKYAKIGETTGTFLNSSQYLSSDLSWAASSMVLSADPVCYANATEQGIAVSDALEWNFSHLTGAVGLVVPPPLKNIIFLRSGSIWKMRLSLDAGMAFKNVELTIAQNLGTRGDAQGTIPVIGFSTTEFAQNTTMDIIVEGNGKYDVALLMQNHDGSSSMMHVFTMVLVS
jgi:hypothetical protein